MTPLIPSSACSPITFPSGEGYHPNPASHPEKEMVSGSFTNPELQELGEKTLQLIRQGFYLTSKGEKVLLQSGEALAKKSQRSPIISVITDDIEKYSQNARITVTSQDCLAAAYEQVQKGYRVIVVNFASPHCPGGGFLEISNGQEENFCYRTDLAGFMQLQGEIIEDGLWKKPTVRKELLENHPEKLLYPLCPIRTKEGFELKIVEGAVLTCDVTVFRAGQDHFYRLLDVPFKIGVLSIAAPDSPPLVGLGTEQVDYAKEEDRQKIKLQILTQLLIAAKEGYEIIVLRAFGCGAFRNPPNVVAQLYREVIQKHFMRAFKAIIFAVLDPQSPSEHNPTGNLRPFRDAFQQL